jgi:uncharacterized protein (DUF2384 family)
MKVNRRERRARQSVARRHKKDITTISILAASTLGKQRASAWMYTPHPLLDGESPLEIVMQGKLKKAERALADTLSEMAVSNTDLITSQILSQSGGSNST